MKKEQPIVEKNKIVIILLVLLALSLGYIFGKQDNSNSIDMASATKNCIDIWETEKQKIGDVVFDVDVDSWKVTYDKKGERCVSGYNDSSLVFVYDILSGNLLFFWSDFQFIGSDDEKLKEWGKANKKYRNYFGL